MFKYPFLVISILILVLASCKEDPIVDPTPVDTELVKIQKKMEGLWASSSMEIWSSKFVFTPYESAVIDCDVAYTYNFDIVKYMEMDDSLTTISTYFCTPARITKLALYRVVNENKIKISESYRGKIIKKYNYTFNTDSTELKLEASYDDIIDKSYFTPSVFTVYKYVVYLRKQ